jgi:hypothetical protein
MDSNANIIALLINLLKCLLRILLDLFLAFLVITIVIILLIYATATPLIAFEIISPELSNLTNLHDFTIYGYSLNKTLNLIPKSDIDFTAMMSGILLLLIGLLLIGIFKKDGGITILPFEVVPSQEGLNGKAIAELLIVNIKRINKIYDGGLNPKPNWFKGKKNPAGIYPEKFVQEQIELPQPQFGTEGENISQKIESVGTIGIGQTSLPLGNIMILLRQICPGANPGIVIGGHIQRFKSDISLVAYMKSKNESWLLRQKILNSKKISYDELNTVAKNLSFKIFFEILCLEQIKPNRILCSLWRDFYSGQSLRRVQPKNWVILKYYTEAMGCLQKYALCNEEELLDHAKKYALKAAYADLQYRPSFILLYHVGIAYINLRKNDAAEKLARCAICLKPDSSLAWYSWGASLRLKKFNKEAIECFDKAIELSEFDKESDISVEIYFIRANTLRRLKRYDEAIMDFLLYFGHKRDNGYAWGYYGLTLEAKAKSLGANDEKRDYLQSAAERAYLNSIRWQPDFFPVHAALARIYRKYAQESKGVFDAKLYREQAKEECHLAKKYMIANLNKNDYNKTDYNRACTEANCGNVEKARALLEIAIKDVNPEWLEEDPDWDEIRQNESWFHELETRCKADKKRDVENLIIKTTLRKKLDKEHGKRPYFIDKYDIKDPKSLAKKITDSNGGPAPRNISEKFSATKQEALREISWKNKSKNYNIVLGENDYFNINKIVKVDENNLNMIENILIAGFNELLVHQNLYKNDIYHEIKLEDWISYVSNNENSYIRLNDLCISSLEDIDSFILSVPNPNGRKVDIDYIRLNRKLLEIAFPDELEECFYSIDDNRAIKDLIQCKSNLMRARYHALKNEIQPALTLIKCAFKENELSLCDLLDPAFESLQKHDEFQILLKKLT